MPPARVWQGVEDVCAVQWVAHPAEGPRRHQCDVRWRQQSSFFLFFNGFVGCLGRARDWPEAGRRRAGSTGVSGLRPGVGDLEVVDHGEVLAVEGHERGVPDVSCGRDERVGQAGAMGWAVLASVGASQACHLNVNGYGGPRISDHVLSLVSG